MCDSDNDNSEDQSDQPCAKKVKLHYGILPILPSHHFQQSSQESQNIIIETGHHPDQLNTRQTINVVVNNSKRERQKQYRERNRDKLKHREAERRKRIQSSQSIIGPSTSSNSNIMDVNNEEPVTAISSTLQNRRDRQKRYREKNREKFSQREAERRRRLKNAESIIELHTSTNIENREIITEPKIIIDEQISVRPAMLSDHNYTRSNEAADTHDSVPAMSRDVLAQGTVDTDDTRYYNRMNGQTQTQYVTVQEIKVEYDAAANQEYISTEHTTSSDMVCRSTATGDVIHDIKAENDHDVECGSTTTEDLFADDIKVEIKQEIITPEDCTNIDMMCGSTLPSNVPFSNVKVDNCVMSQDGASEGATNTDGKHGDMLLGEDYSSAAGLPAAETIHKVQLSDTAVPYVTKISDDLIRRSYDMRTPAAEKPFPCLICNKPFRSLGNLREHIDMHLGVKPYCCKVCNKRFSLKGNLTSHMSIHLGDKPFSCEVCHKSFRQKGNLISHMRTHLVEKPFSCHICHKTFCQKGALKIHIGRHSEAKPFPCDICKKAFKVKGNLIEHMKTHSEEKPFSCEICNKTFSRKSSLTSHLRTHSGERPFSCHICNKTFGQKCTLTLHLRTHSGVKPFSCDTCGRAFVLKSNLVKHMQVHSGEKPFSCEVCGKAFRRSSGFKAHLRTHLHLKRRLEP